MSILRSLFGGRRRRRRVSYYEAQDLMRESAQRSTVVEMVNHTSDMLQHIVATETNAVRVDAAVKELQARGKPVEAGPRLTPSDRTE